MELDRFNRHSPPFKGGAARSAGGGYKSREATAVQ